MLPERRCNGITLVPRHCFAGGRDLSFKKGRWLVRIPAFREWPTLRPPRGAIVRRVLVIMAPTDADVVSVRALGRRLRPLGVELVAAGECHGEIDGERGRPLIPNLLLIEAAEQDWDAVILAGGKGALLVAEDQLAREVAARVAARHRPVAALGLGHAVVDRARIDSFAANDRDELARWLCERFGLAWRAGVAFAGLHGAEAHHGR
jgi:hypothetical protein